MNNDDIADLETIRQGAAKGATAVQDVTNKVDKVSGKQLSTEDFTTDFFCYPISCNFSNY